MQQSRFAAKVPVGVAGRSGNFTTLCVGGKLDSRHSILHLGQLGVEVFLSANLAARYVLSAAASDFNKDRPASRGIYPVGILVATAFASQNARCPGLADGLYQFSALKQFDIPRAVSRKDATDSSAEDSRGVVREIHPNRGPFLCSAASANPGGRRADACWPL